MKKALPLILRVGLVCLIFAPILIAGCVPSYWDIAASLQEASLCCQSPRDFSYRKLQIGESDSFSINDTSQAYIFDSGKSYFKAFELQESTTPYHIVVDSYVLGTGGTGPIRSYLFSPVLITYDADYQVVRRSLPVKELSLAGQFEAIMASFSACRVKLTTQLSFSEENRAEKYLVILTTDHLLSEPSTFQPKYSSLVQIKNVAVGVLRIELIPEN